MAKQLKGGQYRLRPCRFGGNQENFAPLEDILEQMRANPLNLGEPQNSIIRTAMERLRIAQEQARAQRTNVEVAVREQIAAPNRQQDYGAQETAVRVRGPQEEPIQNREERDSNNRQDANPAFRRSRRSRDSHQGTGSSGSGNSTNSTD